jgi:transcriptional regulator with XRE-family HTH domain
MFEESDYRLPHFIRHRRERLAMTQQQLASFINVSIEYVALLESGDRQLEHYRIHALANALAIDRSYLCLMAVLEGTSPIARHYFWDPLLADIAKGGDA